MSCRIVVRAGPTAPVYAPYHPEIRPCRNESENVEMSLKKRI